MAAKEFAKFVSGFEAFHAAANAYFWLSGASIELFGVTTSPNMHLYSAAFNGALSIALGVYAWRR